MGEEALKNGTVSRIAKVHHKRMASFQRSNNKYEVMRVKQKKNKRRMRRKKTTKTKRRRIIVDNYPQHPVSSLTVADDVVGRRISVDNNPRHPVSSLTVADDAVGRWISVDNNPQHPVSSLTAADDAVVCSLIAGDDVVVCQILSRLPVKSLMRFKCVCKLWKSIIEEDSHFINLHLGHSEKPPSLFILLQKNAEFIKRYHESFFSADLHFTGRAANIHTVSKALSFSYRKVLGPIGGLICFVDVFAVRAYKCQHQRSNTMDHFTSICEIRKREWHGDNTWREIDELPPYLHIGATSVSANGSIYWNLLRHFVGGGIGIKPKLECSDSEDMKLFDDEDTDWIMAFDIGSYFKGSGGRNLHAVSYQQAKVELC
ncbi:hypothetical protein C5167_005368 [Papaver somniferum]|uniref:F-box domain-containing protein n=1 Tax=Papaver somniferum TaxID=3469 RepID=A0A4Y7JEK1_PAPSO|nr:hypothetical protein C5167_005368 [Papaver somniferum]